MSKQQDIATNLRKIATIYYQQGDYDQAIIYFNKSLEIRQQQGETKVIESTLNEVQLSEVAIVPMDQQFLQKVTTTIEAHLGDEQFGVETLSEAVAMSVTHLNRKLNALIGKSAGKLIRCIRLQHAAILLHKKVGTISEIAYDLGFSNPTHFTRSFKRYFGVAPSEYSCLSKQTFSKTSPQNA